MINKNVPKFFSIFCKLCPYEKNRLLSFDGIQFPISILLDPLKLEI